MLVVSERKGQRKIISPQANVPILRTTNHSSQSFFLAQIQKSIKLHTHKHTFFKNFACFLFDFESQPSPTQHVLVVIFLIGDWKNEEEKK